VNSINDFMSKNHNSINRNDKFFTEIVNNLVIVQLVENDEIVRSDIHDCGSIPSHSTLYV
jgi:hypothetical protein